MKTLLGLAAASLAALVCISPAAAQMAGDGAWIQPAAAYGYADDPGAAAPAPAADGSYPDMPCDCNCDGKWIGTVDLIAFNRYPGQSQTVLSSPGGQPLLTLNDMKFDYEIAPRVSLIRKDVYHGWDLEFGYFGIDNWNWYSRVNTPSGQVFSAPGVSVPALPPVGMDINYDARMYNLEMNARKQINENWTFLAGFRWIELQEGFNGRRVGGAPELVFWHSQTMNHLYGFQLGAERMLWAGIGGRFRLDAQVKAGAYGNHAEQRSNSPVVNATREAAAVDNVPAFVGEASLTSSYQLTCHWAVRGGWQGMWMESVALAPAQFPVTNIGASTAAIDTRGGVFAQGGFFGLEACY